MVSLFLTSLTPSIIAINIGEDICYQQFTEYFKEQKVSYTFLCRAIQIVKSQLRFCCNLYSYTIIREENATWNRGPAQGNFKLGREFYRIPLSNTKKSMYYSLHLLLLLLLIPNKQEFFQGIILETNIYIHSAPHEEFQIYSKWAQKSKRK